MTPSRSLCAQTHEIDKEARDLAKKVAVRLVGKLGITDSDQEDIVQELLFKLAKRLHKYDPAIPWRNFVKMIYKRHVATMLEARRCHTRGGDIVHLSLSEVVLDAEGQEATLGDLARKDHVPRLSNDAVLLDHDQIDLRMDVDEAIRRLPSKLQRLAELLKYYSPSEAAKELKVPRTTVYANMLKIREAFEKMGIEKLL